jgi:2-polyprenyl-6-hydroxyphenyl methylase / 3-demethylubiquinone-9 3-methyltransferase
VNVDSTEIDKYNSWATEWWTPNGEFRALRRMHELHLALLQSLVSLPGLRALDVGCGGGLFSEMLAKCGAHVTGIDLSAVSIHSAAEHARQGGLEIHYSPRSVEDVAREEPASFDLVCCTEVLEHVPDAKEMVLHIAQTAKPGGWVLLSTENRTLAAYMGAIFAAELIFHFTPRGAHQWSRFIKPAELTSWAREGDLAPAGSRGISYNLFSKDFYLTPWMGISYVLFFRKAVR